MEKSHHYDDDVEHVYRDGNFSQTENEEIISRFSPAEVKALMRRIDLRLIPLCGGMYCISLLDRTNLSNAAIAGYGGAKANEWARRLILSVLQNAR